MAPAALHCQNNPRAATQDFITIASRLLLLSMFPLMLGISFDFYLIARLILNKTVLSLLLATVLLCLISTLWFLFPRLTFLQKIVRGDD
jgi:hypothetical protein